MALLTWADLSWDEFVTGLEGYRDPTPARVEKTRRISGASR